MKLKEEEQKLLEKYLEGLTSSDENKIVESLFADSQHEFELKRFFEREWDHTDNNSTGNKEKLNRILDHIHHIIHKNEYRRRSRFIYKVVNLYTKAAAILILPLIIAGIIGYYNIRKDLSSTSYPEKEVLINEISTSTIIAPFGSRISFTLPDSTKGMLNSGSKLTYSIPFSSNRKVALEGEAWFDVKHDAANPFEIIAGNSNLKVLGTSFNISAYPAENYIEVVLAHGKVEFSDNENSSRVTMFPSERLIYHNGNIIKSVTDPAKYNSWTEGKLVFRGDLMAEVGRRIERWYNVKFELADRELEKYSFRGTFVDDSLDEVLTLLSMTSPIRYKITPRKIMSDGTYEKEKVTIYLKK
jgi:transmembrane sensor